MPYHALWPLNARAAIFDFDGTLADTAHIWREVDRAFLEKRGLPYTADYAQRLAAFGFAAGAAYTIERFGLNETVDEICDEWNELSRSLYTNTVVLRPAARRYLNALRACGVRIALATTNIAYVLESMRHIDTRTLFDVRVYGDEVVYGKDHPDIYLEAARRLGTDPADCVVFEDIVPALRSARGIGMRTCAVRANDPNQRVSELQELCDVWLEDWRDIPIG